MQSTVVIAVDGLGASWIGPYGNTWIETPAFDQLAATGVVGETVIADRLELPSAYEALWGGGHCRAARPSQGRTLARAAAEAGLSTLLITDDEAVANHRLSADFQRREVITQQAAKLSAQAIEETQLWRLFDSAAEAVSACHQPSLIWIHARGLTGSWDAPLDFRNQFADEEDPAPPEFVDPPQRSYEAAADPDELLGLAHACAGQIALLDLCLARLGECLAANHALRDGLWAVASPRGYPLGEHGHVGLAQAPLYVEALQVPLLMRLPGGAHALARTRSVRQLGDFAGLVATACGWPWPGQGDEWKAWLEEAGPPRAAFSFATGQRSIRTPAWFLRESVGESGLHQELYVKPDDHWEVNEVSSRCGEVAELLAQRLNEFETRADGGSLAETSPLPQILCDCWH